jgi:hypothetical protein
MDSEHILAWTWHPDCGDAFLMFKDRSNEFEVVGKNVMTVNGHPTFLPKEKNQWIVNDTYPDKFRNQKLFLYDTIGRQKWPLGIFKSPSTYNGELRCDLHPSASRDGLKISFDSAHELQGRNVYVVELDESAFSV